MGPQGVPGVSGFELVTATSGSNNTSPKTVTATCPAGKVVLGGGYMTTTVTQASALQNGPVTNATWTVRVAENQTGTPTWTLNVTVACVTALP
jgi:hypothetical protein